MPTSKCGTWTHHCNASCMPSGESVISLLHLRSEFHECISSTALGLWVTLPSDNLSRDRKSIPDPPATRTEGRRHSKERGRERDRDPSAEGRSARASDSTAGRRGLGERDTRRTSGAAAGSAATGGNEPSANPGFARPSLEERDRIRERGDQFAAAPEARVATSDARLSWETVNLSTSTLDKSERREERVRDRASRPGYSTGLEAERLGREPARAGGTGSDSQARPSAALAPSRLDKPGPGPRAGPNHFAMQPPPERARDFGLGSLRYPQGRSTSPPRHTNANLPRQPGSLQPGFSPADTLTRGRGAPPDYQPPNSAARSPSKRMPELHQRLPDSPPYMRGPLEDFQPVGKQQRYRTTNAVGIRSDQIASSRPGPDLQMHSRQLSNADDDHPAQYQRLGDSGEGRPPFRNPPQHPPLYGGQRDSSSPFPQHAGGQYAAGRDPSAGPSRQNYPIPVGPVGPLSMQHRLSDNRNFYMDGGPPILQQQLQQQQLFR